MVGGSAALRTTLEETYLKEHRGQSANVTEPAESEAPPEKNWHIGLRYHLRVDVTLFLSLSLDSDH